MECREKLIGVILAILFAMPAQGNALSDELYAKPLCNLSDAELAVVLEYLTYFREEKFRPSPAELVGIMSELFCPVRTSEAVYEEIDYYHRNSHYVQPHAERPNILREVEPVCSHPVAAQVMERLGGYWRVREWDAHSEGRLVDRVAAVYRDVAEGWVRSARGQFLGAISSRDPLYFAVYPPFAPPPHSSVLATMPLLIGGTASDPLRLEGIKAIFARSV